MTILPHLLRYRELLYLGETSGLSMPQLLTFEALGSTLSQQTIVNASPTVTAQLAIDGFDHIVELLELGPEQIVCRTRSQLVVGNNLGLRLNDTTDNRTYLFRTQVDSSWQEPGNEGWWNTMSFIGCPVRLSWGTRRSAPTAGIVELEASLLAA